MDVLLSGGTGFIGTYLARHLSRVFGAYVFAEPFDVTDVGLRRDILSKKKWDVVIHLAGLSKISDFAENKETGFYVNTIAAADFFRDAIESNPSVFFLFPSTAYVYRSDVFRSGSPIKENSAIGPQNEYAKSKFFAEALLNELASQSEQSKLCVVRIFNCTFHTQPPVFFMPSVYVQLMKAKQEETVCQVKVGDVTLARDFSSIQDLLSAFEVLISKRVLLEKKSVFNICSGKAKRLDLIIQKMAEKIGVRYELVIDESLKRKNDPQQIVGDCQRLKQIGWAPQSLDEESLVTQFLSRSV